LTPTCLFRDSSVNGVLIFKLEEEEASALLLHLLYLIVETSVFGSAFGFGCLLVVATVQATAHKTANF
jgi:hypothetical protein